MFWEEEDFDLGHRLHHTDYTVEANIIWNSSFNQVQLFYSTCRSARHCANCQLPEQIKANWMTLPHIRHIHTRISGAFKPRRQKLLWSFETPGTTNPPESNNLKMTRCELHSLGTYVTFKQELVEPSNHEDKSYYDPSKPREPRTHQKAIIWKWQDANWIYWNPQTTDELLRIRYRNVDIHKMCAISWRAEQPSASQYISCFPWVTIPPSLHTHPPNTAQSWLLTASLKT